MKLGDLKDLKEEFPKGKISWRAQTMKKDGSKAMALAYIDARDVMNRLDEVCGPENWTDSYLITEGRTICRLGICLRTPATEEEASDREWIYKSDGAGETQVEGDKGAMSDAFKRAAVKWGIGRYLYDMPAPWVPCQSVNGKFKKFTADPWEFVAGKKEPVIGELTRTKLQAKLREFDGDLRRVSDTDELSGVLASYGEALKQCKDDLPTWYYGKEESDVLGFQDRIIEKQKELEAREQTPLEAG